MNILITNDDGIRAPGLKSLFQALTKKHHVTVVAPDREKSATSHRLTIHDPLRAFPFDDGIQGFAVNGTPVDCIKLGVSQLLSKKPDWVISGINPGANTGFNVFYSGTVAAAREAASMWIPSMAVSIAMGSTLDYEGAAESVCDLIHRFSRKILPVGTLLNVNFPSCPVLESKGFLFVNQAIYHLYEKYEKRKDPRQVDYYWIGDEKFPIVKECTTDFGAIENKYIAISPLTVDTTDYDFLNQIKHWDLDN
jgi:5'-nucleotidase